MSTYLERKALRIKIAQEQTKMITVKCSACSGSGYYDNTGNPKCDSCSGTGKVKQYAY